MTALAAGGEDDLCADKGVPTVVRQGSVREPVGMLPVIAEEVGGDGVADGDELNMGDTTGPEWDVGSMLVMQRGLVAASWVAGRRRVTREGTEREGRECRRKGNGGIEVELETAVMDVDTSEDSSLRSLIGDEAGVIGSQDEDEAVVDDLAPQAPSHARGEGHKAAKAGAERETVVVEPYGHDGCEEEKTIRRREKVIQKDRQIGRQQKRRKDSHSYRWTLENAAITVAQNAGEFRTKRRLY